MTSILGSWHTGGSDPDSQKRTNAEDEFGALTATLAEPGQLHPTGWFQRATVETPAAFLQDRQGEITCPEAGRCARFDSPSMNGRIHPENVA